MSFHHFVALRYLLGARGRGQGFGFLRFITIVAIGGVAIGTGALLLALAIVRGFGQEIEAKIIGFGAHVQIESMRYAPLENADDLLLRLEDHDAIARIHPVVTEFALLRRSRSQIDGVSLWGTDALPTYLRDHIVDGEAALQTDSAGRNALVVGATLARELGLQVGDPVTVFSTRNMRTEGGPTSMLAARPRVKQFQITGVYETSLADFDATYVFADLEVARDLFAYAATEVTRLDLMLADVHAAGEVARDIEDTYGVPIMARTIFQIYHGLFAWVNLQEAIIPVVIGIMILVAAFNIIGILLMIILEKTREIGVFASMGASRQALRHLFLRLGLLIGTVGTSIGLGVALVLALLQQRYDLIPLPAETYYMTTAPVALNPVDFLLVGVISLILCGLAAYIPARVAARIEPVRVIRFN